MRIQVQACGICHSDVITKEGLFAGITYPRVPGHEVAGLIDELGSGVKEWQKGQRAGLTVYIIENGGEKVMFWGDVVNIALQVDDPDISLRFDSDAAAAAATRRKLLEDAARNGYIVAPDHLPFPGLGHIRKDGHAYTWVPVDYVNDAVKK